MKKLANVILFNSQIIKLKIKSKMRKKKRNFKPNRTHFSKHEMAIDPLALTQEEILHRKSLKLQYKDRALERR